MFLIYCIKNRDLYASLLRQLYSIDIRDYNCFEDAGVIYVRDNCTKCIIKKLDDYVYQVSRYFYEIGDDKKVTFNTKVTFGTMIVMVDKDNKVVSLISALDYILFFYNFEIFVEYEWPLQCILMDLYNILSSNKILEDVNGEDFLSISHKIHSQCDKKIIDVKFITDDLYFVLCEDNTICLVKLVKDGFVLFTTINNESNYICFDIQLIYDNKCVIKGGTFTTLDRSPVEPVENGVLTTIKNIINK